MDGGSSERSSRNGKRQVIKGKHRLLTVELDSINSILLTQMDELNADQRKELNFNALGSINTHKTVGKKYSAHFPATSKKKSLNTDRDL